MLPRITWSASVMGAAPSRSFASDIVSGSVGEILVPGLPGVVPGGHELALVPSGVTAAERIGGQREGEKIVAALQLLLVLETRDDTAGKRCHLLVGARAALGA